MSGMDEIDDLLETLLQRQNAAKVSYVDDEYVDAFKVKETGSRGQGVFAQCAFSVAEPICSLSYPTIAAIDTEALRTTCYYCLVVTEAPLPLPSLGHVEVELKACSGCRSAYFCNKDCQTKAWHAFHRHECRIFNNLQPKLPPAVFRAVMRMVLLRDRGTLSETDWDRVTALVSHEQITTAQGRSNLTDMAVGIKHLTKSAMHVGLIQKLIFIMKFNASELPTTVYGSIGVMLNPLMAKFNHSCEPNLAMRRPQYTMVSGWMNCAQTSGDEREVFAQVVPLRNIEEGEELFNCYVAPTISVSARKAKLAEDYLFECRCSRCELDVTNMAYLMEGQSQVIPRFQEWTRTVARHLSRTGKDPGHFIKAAASADKLEQFMTHPALYASGDFPQMAMELLLGGLKAQRLDDALINALRICFLVNPARFIGRHNPTNIYTAFLVLDIFDALLLDATYSKISGEKVGQSLRRLQARGLSKDDLIYWRNRICADLRNRLEGTASSDLLVLVKKLEDRALWLERSTQEGDWKFAKLSETGMEERLSSALRMKSFGWSAALQQTQC